MTRNMTHNESMLKYLNKRYTTDETFRKSLAAKAKDRYNKDPIFKKRANERASLRYLFNKEFNTLCKIDVF